MPSLQQTKDVFELLSYVVVVLGVPTGLFQYVRATRQEAHEREHRIYDAINADYLEFLKLCLQYPRFDVFDAPDAVPTELSPQEQKEELILLSILFTIFERAYVLYRDRPTEVTRGQWHGWDGHIRAYFRRENVRRAWRIGENTYDPRFAAYMATIDDHAPGVLTAHPLPPA